MSHALYYDRVHNLTSLNRLLQRAVLLSGHKRNKLLAKAERLNRMCAEISPEAHSAMVRENIANGNWLILLFEKFDESLVLFMLAYGYTYRDMAFYHMKGGVKLKEEMCVLHHPLPPSIKCNDVDVGSWTLKDINEKCARVMTNWTGRRRNEASSVHHVDKYEPLLTPDVRNMLKEAQACDDQLYRVASELHQLRVVEIGGQEVMSDHVRKLIRARQSRKRECDLILKRGYDGNHPPWEWQVCRTMLMDNKEWNFAQKELCRCGRPLFGVMKTFRIPHNQSVCECLAKDPPKY